MAKSSVRYFITVYGSQHHVVNRPNLSHTFATFTSRGGAVVGRPESTISWLPLDEKINPFGPAEPGRNFTIDETFTWLDRAKSTLRWESPETEIRKALFDSANERIQELEAGVLQYKMIDSVQTRPDKVSNCIHGVSDLSVALSTLGMAYTGILHGILASRFVYNYLQSFYLTNPSLPPEDEDLFEELTHAHMQSQMNSAPKKVATGKRARRAPPRA